MVKKLCIIFIAIIFAQNAWADLITTDIENGCMREQNFHAIFKPIEYTCAQGYFLPADTLGCVPCATNQTCPGGAYKYNETKSQGIKYQYLINNNLANSCAYNMPRNFDARFVVNSYTCDAGYYLDADALQCAICPQNYYCPGGTYDYNKTTAQGINPCPPGLYSPRGMWRESQCGQKLHFGNDALFMHKQENQQFDNPGLYFMTQVQGQRYYAHATPITDGRKKMSIDANYELHVKFNDTEYTVHDESVHD